MRWTSSTPASAARSSTASMTRWRMSGRRIGRQRQRDVVEGDGELHARPQQGAAAARCRRAGARARGGWRRRGRRSAGQRLGRVDDPAAAGRQASPAGSPRRGGTGSGGVERSTSSTKPGLGIGSAASRCGGRRRPSRRPAAGVGGVLDGVLVAGQGVGGAHQAAEVERAPPARRRGRRCGGVATVERLGAVGVGAREARPRGATAVRSSVDAPGMPTRWTRAAGAHDRQRPGRSRPRCPRSRPRRRRRR